MTVRLSLPILCLTVALAAGTLPAAGHNEGLPSVPLSSNNVEHVANLPNLVGNNIDWLERVDEDGEVRRYLIAANVGNGFDIVDVTEPGHPTVVGRYLLPDNDPAALEQSSLGSNYHAWVSVNPRRNIVALTIEDPGGRTLRHNGGGGIQFVDISDLTNPVALGQVDGLDGPHTVRMIGNNHAYTSLNTWVVDYSDAMNPVAAKRGVEGHEFWEDPNNPGTMWVGMATTVGRFGAFNISDPGNPVQLGSWADLDIVAAHEVYPAPDGSYIGVADFTNGQFDASCPGGAVHFYDISGEYVPGAGPSNPLKMGQWFAPHSGVQPDQSASGPNSGSCTMHSWHHHPERSLALGGLYTGGTWVFDPTSPPTADGDYSEYDGARGTTTWGSTVGHFQDGLDFVNAAQFLPFDLTDSEHDKLFAVSGFERGVDIYRFTGDLPPKLSDLEVSASGGAVTGTLQRYAVLGPDGYEQLPLAGRTVQVSGGGAVVTAITSATGAFSASLPVAPGDTVAVSWPGDDVFAPNEVTVTAS